MIVFKNVFGFEEIRGYLKQNPFDSNLFCNTGVANSLNIEGLSEDEIKKIPQQKTRWALKYLSNPDSLKVNSYNFRSDEFKKNHDGLHILFTGCSVTYGVGLYSQETWSYKLYNKIKKTENVSGYYNLSISGSSIMEIVTNIFKYVKMYNKPDVIFLNLPDLARFYFIHNSSDSSILHPQDWDYFYDKKDNEYCYTGVVTHNSSKLNKFIESLKLNVYEYLLMLNVFCKENNIKLYTFSYIDRTYNFLTTKTDLDNFYLINHKKMDNLIAEYIRNNPNDDFAIFARDQLGIDVLPHPGTAVNHAWAEIMYNYYKENNVN